MSDFNITPPPELVTRLRYEAPTGELAPRELHLIAAAYRAGADYEMEACCADIHTVYGKRQAAWLRATRRPKPPGLRQQACDALDTYVYGNPDQDDKVRTYNTIRRALEALPE